MSLVYPTAQRWVAEHFVHVYPRVVGGESRWCPQWWRHAEAIARFEALWRSWEAARSDPARGMAYWYRDCLDPQIQVLFGARGPFARCTLDRHEDSVSLPVEPPPIGWFPG